MPHTEPSPDHPLYEKVLEDPVRPTKTYMITCDEGWRESIVCMGMYEWAADWLIGVIQGLPYAPDADYFSIDFRGRIKA